jgi:hypothetical protein
MRTTAQERKMNIITWLIETEHCKNVPHAEATIALLKLGELYNAKDDAGIVARVELYEAWKKSGMYKKSDRAACAMKAIAGEPVPQPVVDMFATDEHIGEIDEEDVIESDPNGELLGDILRIWKSG